MRTAVLLLLMSVPNAYAQNVRVVDGDTLKVLDISYRLHGIDAPEHDQHCGDWKCGEDATKRMKTLIEGKMVNCNVIDTDRHGRKIATCFADDIDVGRQMVVEGLAWAYLRFSRVYEGDQTLAKKEGIGIWNGSFEEPWVFRKKKSKGKLNRFFCFEWLSCSTK